MKRRVVGVRCRTAYEARQSVDVTVPLKDDGGFRYRVCKQFCINEVCNGWEDSRLQIHNVGIVVVQLGDGLKD
jgi:hypothetical protein